VAPEEPKRGVRSLVVDTEDGAMYAIPQEELERFRLSDDQRAAVQASLPTRDDDVAGYGYEGQFKMTRPYAYGYGPNVWWTDTPYHLDSDPGPYPGLH
jgi:hypothetical protein